MKKLAKTALVGSLVIAGASPFAMTAMAQGYQNKTVKCDKTDKKCAEKKAKKAETKKAEAKCGEGKCGGVSTKSKKADAKCGEGKCGEGRCGGSK